MTPGTEAIRPSSIVPTLKRRDVPPGRSSVFYPRALERRGRRLHAERGDDGSQSRIVWINSSILSD
ncbi:MAG: hypothetical protein ACOYM4_01630 [Nodosilinea sp.]